MNKVDSATPLETATLPEDEQALEALREILVGHYSDRVIDLNEELDQVHSVLTLLEEQINDKDALVETITPIIAKSIRTSIRDSRDEMVDALNPIIAESIRASITDSRGQMIDALYPIMGSLVTRAVSEAMQDLARKIDSQMRRTMSFEAIKRRFVAQAHGVSNADIIIRDSMPFEVIEVFLIHRETGILLLYLADTDDDQANSEIDSELISGMLTAIQDFAQDAFGRGEESDLSEVHSGGKEILIESTQAVYIAVVSKGIEPVGYRATVREMLYEIDQRYNHLLKEFNGDVTQFSAAQVQLDSLIHRETTTAEEIEIDGQLSDSGNSNAKMRGDFSFPPPKRDERTLLITAASLIVVFLLIYLLFG